MSIDNPKIIDFIGIDNESGNVMLTISDHFEWNGNFDKEHIRLLQEKFNAYLAFIESGEIFESCPNAKDKKIVISVVGKYPLNDLAKSFYEYSKKIIHEAGFELRFELFKENKN